jgi:high-affinity nickel permease
MIQMLEFICSIPNWIGWTFVSIVGCLNVVMFYQLGKIFVQMWKDRHEEEEEMDALKI